MTDKTHRPSQWKHDCDCCEAVAEARDTNKWVRMHSELREYNSDYFAWKMDGTTESELLEILSEHDGRVIICNCCHSIKTVESDGEDESEAYDWSQHA